MGGVREATNEELAAFARLLTDLAHFDEQFWELHVGDRPAPGSPAAAEAALLETGPGGSWGSVPFEIPYQIAGLLLRASICDIQSLARLFGPPVIPYGFEPVRRSLLEYTARAWWLLDPALSPRERVTRAWTEQLDSAQETDKTTEAFGLKPEEVPRQVPAVIASAADLGLTELWNKPHDKLLGFGAKPRPQSTDLAGEFLLACGMDRGSGYYRRLCGVAHGSISSIIAGLVETGPADVAHAARMATAVDFVTVWITCWMAMNTYRVAGRCRSNAYGWDTSLLDSWHQTQTERLHQIGRDRATIASNGTVSFD